ncbi:hypothetical protein [Alkalicoccus daliensis]|uniref:Uncharacterized protein n=1 Tax=Alkalicoccus daliensis TaxID=745820 RepID=A0A1H0GK09_9BACI|nr:hypothetical protein [Alkalicoccus daliensis]SDO07286.1 hypothetical protein SAMN04488053_106142 [Alkalicoccus daliensis]
MKKKIWVTMLSSIFAVSTLAACGDTPENGVNNPDVENEPQINEDANMNNGINEPVGDVENDNTDL